MIIGHGAFAANALAGGASAGSLSDPATVSTQPVSVSVVAGAVATFTVLAAGSAPLAYQWRRGGVAIAGATSSSYALTTLLGDNGALFSVVISNGSGSVTSGNATLTVTAAASVPGDGAVTWLTDDLPLNGSGWLASLYNGHGVLGADVPPSTPGDLSFGSDDVTLPQDAGVQFRWRILRLPTAGTLTLSENSRYSFAGAPHGRYFFDVEVFRNARSYGVRRIMLLLGPQLSLVEQLHTTLAPLALGGAWYATNESGASAADNPYPFITVQRVGAAPNVGLGGPSDLQNTRVQIDIHARTIAECVAIELRVQQMMDAWSVTNVPISRLDLYEDATRTHRVVLDYSIWSYT